MTAKWLRPVCTVWQVQGQIKQQETMQAHKHATLPLNGSGCFVDETSWVHKSCKFQQGSPLVQSHLSPPKKIYGPNCRQIPYNENCSSVHWNWKDPPGLHATIWSKVKRLLLPVALAASCAIASRQHLTWAAPWFLLQGQAMGLPTAKAQRSWERKDLLLNSPVSNKVGLFKLWKKWGFLKFWDPWLYF